MSWKSNPQRGHVLRVRLDPVVGSEQAGERPALVLSPNFFNERSPVILIAAITSKKTEYTYPFEVALEPPEGGLRLRSKVKLSQMRSIAKERIVGHYGMVSDAVMNRVDDAIKIVAGLTRLED